MFNLKTTFRAYFDLTTAMFIAGSSVVASKLLVQTLPIFLASEINYISFLSVLYYGTFISVISFILWFRAIEKVSASSAAVFSGVMPISSMLLSSLILKEKISYFHIISLILIIKGICASCLKFKKTAFNKQFDYKL